MFWIWVKEAIMITGLSVAAMMDWMFQYVSARWLAVFLLAACLFRLLTGGLLSPDTLLGIIPGLFAFAMTKFSKGALGEADGWILLAMGLCAGMEIALSAGAAAFFLAGIAAIILKAKKWGENTFPFIPFLYVGYVLVRGLQLYGI